MAGLQRLAAATMPNAPGSDSNWWTWGGTQSPSGGVSTDSWASYTSLGSLPWKLVIPDSDGNASLMAAMDKFKLELLLQGGLCAAFNGIAAGARGGINSGAAQVPSSGAGIGDWWAWTMNASIRQVANSPGGGFEALPATWNGQLWIANSATNSARATIADSFGLI